MYTLLFVLPAALHMVFIVYLGRRMFSERVKAVKDGHVDPKFFKAYNAERGVPENIVISGRHFDNQFQVPMMYQVAMLFALQLGAVNVFTIFLNWLFFGSRLAHSVIHLGRNHPLKRAQVYMIGIGTLIVLWISIVVILIKGL